MIIGYAPRRGSYYPTTGWGNKGIPPKEVRGKWLAKVRSIGFEGVEITASSPDEPGGSEQEVKDLRSELEDAGLTCIAARTASRVTGAGFVKSQHAPRNRQLQLDGIRYARLIGAPIMATTVGTQVDQKAPGAGHGEETSQWGSRTAGAADFERNAKAMAEIGDIAADHGIEVAIEMAQHSVADNSWSMNHLLDLIDRPNVGANADLGNVVWAYDTPEETVEACIVALAPRLKYWHCKNLIRVNIPDLGKSVFIAAPLVAGDIDYRFAISAVADAGFQGCIAIEGRAADELTQDGASVAYVKSLLAELD